ncbi:protein TolQ [Marinagarivorans algicola]|uniref:protein TolQ n=1 Tax=Marinagarivorans algicola TaxID=1513270 RepID=UPI0006B94FAC|nr:protein TolQ [Marinagarivorans algicola]
MNPTETLSIFDLIADAGPVVMLVMLALLSASVVSWFMIVQRFIFHSRAARNFNRFERTFWSGGDLAQLYRQGNSHNAEGIEAVFRAGFKEFSRLSQQKNNAAVMEGAQRAMRVALMREQEKLEAHLPFLASVASVSPYVGLFGTVWGILNSFRGLANQHQATLATVAPGISEALVATAMGLFAAIPAVLAYNRFVAKAETLTAKYQTFTEEFSSILHRQIHAE